MPDETTAFEISNRVDTEPLEHTPLFEAEAENIELALQLGRDSIVDIWRFNADATDTEGNNDLTLNSGAVIDNSNQLLGAGCLGLTSSYAYKSSSVVGIGGGDGIQIEAHIKLKAINQWNIIFALGNIVGADYILFRLNTSNQLTFSVIGGGVPRSFTSTASLTDLTGHHTLIAYYEKGVSSSNIGVILDDVDMPGTVSGAFNGPVTTISSFLGIGAQWTGTWALPSDFYADSVRVRNTLLSSADNTALHNSGAGVEISDTDYSTSSPSPVQVWNARKIGTIIKPSTARLIVYKDEVPQSYASTDLLLKYAVNGGALSASMTQAAFRALANIEITDATQSVKIVPVFISDGSYQTKCRAVLYMDETPPESSAGDTIFQLPLEVIEINSLEVIEL